MQGQHNNCNSQTYYNQRICEQDLIDQLCPYSHNLQLFTKQTLNRVTASCDSCLMEFQSQAAPSSFFPLIGCTKCNFYYCQKCRQNSFNLGFLFEKQVCMNRHFLMKIDLKKNDHLNLGLVNTCSDCQQQWQQQKHKEVYFCPLCPLTKCKECFLKERKAIPIISPCICSTRGQEEVSNDHQQREFICPYSHEMTFHKNFILENNLKEDEILSKNCHACNCSTADMHSKVLYCKKCDWLLCSNCAHYSFDQSITPRLCSNNHFTQNILSSSGLKFQGKPQHPIKDILIVCNLCSSVMSKSEFENNLKEFQQVHHRQNQTAKNGFNK